MTSLHPENGGERRPRREIPPGVVSIRCRLDGPLVVELPPDADRLGLTLRVVDHQGTPLPLPPSQRPLALCRCGHSGRKPFCDGSHRGSGFRDDPGTASVEHPPNDPGE